MLCKQAQVAGGFWDLDTALHLLCPAGTAFFKDDITGNHGTERGACGDCGLVTRGMWAVITR